MSEYYDEDPKFGFGDGGIEYRGPFNKNKVEENIGKVITRVIIDPIPYDGVSHNQFIEVPKPTFDINSKWHNRPA